MNNLDKKHIPFVDLYSQYRGIKKEIDNEIFNLIEKADKKSQEILTPCKDLIDELSYKLIEDKKLDRDNIEMKIYRKNPDIFKLEF